MQLFNDRKKFSILIVDDEPKNIQLLGNILHKEGYDVEFATSGEEALNWAFSSKFDLILLDVIMPGMTGFEVCKSLKASSESRDVPIIFLTAKTEIEDVVKGFEIGAVDYVTKPFHPTELLVRVRTHLQLKYSMDLLKEMAIMDGLTKLYNHSHIHERLTQEISRARRYGHPLSIIMCDLDHFKKINDTYGHKTGDDVLIRVSAAIKDLLRKEDIPGRYGGEEFLIVLPNTDRDAGYSVAEKIRTHIHQLSWGAEGLHVTISSGITVFEGEETNELIEKADHLLYTAKETGRNRVETD